MNKFVNVENEYIVSVQIGGAGIPITDEEYFEDDIVGRFCDWMKKVFGENSLETNLEFIAKALGNKGGNKGGESCVCVD